MSAVIESTERAPGAPQPMPRSAEAVEFAAACIGCLPDDERLSVACVRNLMATAFDAGVDQARHEAAMALMRRDR